MNGDRVQSDVLRCPTCGAEQVSSAICRRCKCDLTLVVAARARAVGLHQACLRHWRAGEPQRALDCALGRYRLIPDETAHRLLAIAYLRLGHHQAALDVRGRLGD